MVNVKIDWSESFKWEDSDGTMYWRRLWEIPTSYRESFFTFWNSNKFKLWDDGFSVKKIDDNWYLIETKLDKSNFKVFGSNSTQNTTKVVDSVEEPDFKLPHYKVKFTSGLRPWQIDSVSKLVSSINTWNAAIDGSDLGVGKTYVGCAVARELNLKILVVCPKSVMESWRRVIVNHFDMKSSLIDIINYEQLRIGRKDSAIASYVTNRKTHREKFTWKIPKDTLIIWDESQKLKNWKTQNSKVCIEALKLKYKMLFCSATNATTPLELRTVGTVLKLFKGATAYYKWCYEHGVSRGRYGMEFTSDIEIRKKVLKKLHNDIFVNRGSRLTRDVIPDFPKSDILAECYNMDETEVDKINQFHDEMKRELKNLSLKSNKDKASELTAILRARQKTELVKVPLFIDMIEEGLESGMAVVVFLNFTETLQALSKRLKTKCIFDGKVIDSVRQQNVDDFQSGKEKLILVNIASGGAGLNLHDIHGLNPRLALISPSYSAVLMRQSTGRVWRDSSKSKSIQKIVFVAKTIEEKVCEKVKEKLSNLDILNDGDLNL